MDPFVGLLWLPENCFAMRPGGRGTILPALTAPVPHNLQVTKVSQENGRVPDTKLGRCDGTVPNTYLRMDGARHAVVQLRVQLGQLVAGERRVRNLVVLKLN